ncbi:hypothetical protein TNCV_667741 [Trichonephila clavipes]|nr:hypothetical protein TNCV_667741 [Trichonephila clavipes]
MMKRVGKASSLEVVRVQELLNTMFSKKKVTKPVMKSAINENGYAISSGRLLINDPMLHHIINCTEEEAHRQLVIEPSGLMKSLLLRRLKRNDSQKFIWGAENSLRAVEHMDIVRSKCLEIY